MEGDYSENKFDTEEDFTTSDDESTAPSTNSESSTLVNHLAGEFLGPFVQEPSFEVQPNSDPGSSDGVGTPSDGENDLSFVIRKKQTSTSTSSSTCPSSVSHKSIPIYNSNNKLAVVLLRSRKWIEKLERWWKVVKGVLWSVKGCIFVFILFVLLFMSIPTCVLNVFFSIRDMRASMETERKMTGNLLLSAFNDILSRQTTVLDAIHWSLSEKKNTSVSAMGEAFGVWNSLGFATGLLESGSLRMYNGTGYVMNEIDYALSDEEEKSESFVLLYPPEESRWCETGKWCAALGSPPIDSQEEEEADVRAVVGITFDDLEVFDADVLLTFFAMDSSRRVVFGKCEKPIYDEQGGDSYMQEVLNVVVVNVSSTKNEQHVVSLEVDEGEKVSVTIMFNSLLRVFYVTPNGVRRNVKVGLLSSVIVSLLVLLFSLLASSAFGLAITAPISSSAKKLIELSNLDMSSTSMPPTFNLSEFRDMRKSLGILRNGLINFNKFLPTEVLRRTLRENREISLRLTSVTASALFVDIVGFTLMAETCEPATLVSILQTFFVACDESITHSGGLTDKFIGDAVMGLFTQPNHEVVAMGATLRILRILRMVHQKKMLPVELKACCGLNSGNVLIGFVGSRRRISLTAISDTVNVASRLEKLNRMYKTKALVGELTYESGKDKFLFNWIDSFVLKGKTTVTSVYELVCKKEKASADKKRCSELFFELKKNVSQNNVREIKSTCIQIIRKYKKKAVIAKKILKKFKNAKQGIKSCPSFLTVLE